MARRSKYKVGSLVETKRGFIKGQGIIVKEKRFLNNQYNMTDGFVVSWFVNPKFVIYNTMQWADTSQVTKNQIKVISVAA